MHMQAQWEKEVDVFTKQVPVHDEQITKKVHCICVTMYEHVFV